MENINQLRIRLPYKGKSVYLKKEKLVNMGSNKTKKIDEVKILQKSAKVSSSKAQRASKAMGLTIKIISNNEIIEKLPNGERRVVKKIDVITPTKVKGLKKGTILCRK